MIYTLKQFAEMFNTPEHTIRYYTDINLLPCQRDKGNRRIFNEESVNWMQGIALSLIHICVPIIGNMAAAAGIFG